MIHRLSTTTRLITGNATNLITKQSQHVLVAAAKVSGLWKNLNKKMFVLVLGSSIIKALLAQTHW